MSLFKKKTKQFFVKKLHSYNQKCQQKIQIILFKLVYTGEERGGGTLVEQNHQ